MERSVRALALVFLSLFLASCATNSARVASNANFQWSSPTKRVLLVQPDVQLGELTAGGLFEPRADWTQAAQGFVDKDLRTHFARSGAEIVSADRASARDVQLAKLHGVIGQTIFVHLYAGGPKLPNKGDALDWSLGPGTNEMRDRYGTDYALFVYVRDSYATSGRRALQVLGVLAAGVAGAGVVVSGGSQVGFASLVDMRTGNIVWFNRLISGNGDLRTEAPAQSTVDELIKGIPL